MVSWVRHLQFQRMLKSSDSRRIIVSIAKYTIHGAGMNVETRSGTAVDRRKSTLERGNYSGSPVYFLQLYDQYGANLASSPFLLSFFLSFRFSFLSFDLDFGSVISSSTSIVPSFGILHALTKPSSPQV